MNMSFDFTGHTVLVTGAAQGIGYEIASAFTDSGARVAAFDNDPALLDATWAGREDVMPIAVDVADSQAIASAVQHVAEWGGGVATVVNNAGITRDTVVWKLTDEDWKAVLDVHLGGTFNVTRAAIPFMRANGFGRIINVTSYTAMHGNVGQSNYAAAKAAIIGFTKTVAKEVARFGITANAISPNAATAMVKAIPPEKLAALTSAIPQQRFAEPAEMTAAVQFLASAEAGYITGVVLPVDGGMSM
ncbi:SDR family oxidoreductase [Mycolicibacterium sp. XJ662]